MDREFIRHRYSIIRNANNISARKLSFELGQSSEYINQIENGKSLPSLEGLINFCSYFKISIAEFFNEDFKYPIEYKAIIKDLNKLDRIELKLVEDLLKLLTNKK